jgi:hypothetical protein
MLYLIILIGSAEVKNRRQSPCGRKKHRGIFRRGIEG